MREQAKRLGMAAVRPIQRLVILRRTHPTAVLFLDETGAIAKDRFFAVGCLKVCEPSRLLRAVQKVRDEEHWYGEFHWVDLTLNALSVYKRVVDAVAATDQAWFSCFVADRSLADPVARFGTHWLAYEKLATQLLMASIRPYEITTVLADNYSTPDDVLFEHDVKEKVNTRLSRLAVTAVVRLDSKAADPLQIVDLLTGAVAFEFRQSAGLAGTGSPKAKLAAHVRNAFGVGSTLGGFKNDRFNVALYRDTPGRGRTP